MGSKKTYNSTINDFTLNSTSQYTELFSHSYPSINNTSWENLPGTPGRDLHAPDSDTVLMYDTDSKGFYCSGTLEKTFQEYSRIFKADFEDDTTAYSGEIKKNDTLNSFLYLYNTTDPVYLSIKEQNELYRNYIDIWWKEGSLVPSDPHVVFAGSKNICGSSKIPVQERWNKQEDVGIQYIQYGQEEDTKITVDAKITSGGDSGLDPSIAPISVPMNIKGSEYYLTKSIPNMVSLCVDSITLREVIFGGQINAIASPINNIPLYLHLVQKGSQIHADNFDSILVMYLTSKNSSPRIRMMTALNQSINSGGLDMSMDLTPAYKITPYFLLTGTADSTSSVYPRRFVSYKKESNQFKYIDMPYEYNLEKVSVPFNITKSDIEVKKSSYLKKLECYNQNDIDTVKFTLDAGIYTLNITGVPNNLNSAATITVNDTKLAIHTTGTLHTTDKGTIPNEFGFYQPVVFILEQRKDVEISAYDLNAFQDIGLYKVNTVDKDSLSTFIDIYTEAIGAKVCTYQEYMNSLIKTIKDQEENKELLPSERYSLIQKYGIFFKEAYVFTEGLYSGNKINDVAIADSTNGDSLTYKAAPYVPADTSVLPVNLQDYDKNGELTYTWNIYVMPDSILETNYEDKDADIPDFVFTNGVPTAVHITTKPGSQNLRKSYGGFNFPIRDILNDPTNMIPQVPGILGPLSPK